MRRLLTFALACAIGAIAAPDALAQRTTGKSTIGRTATFMLELRADSELKWSYVVPQYRRNCYQRLSSSHEGSERWEIATKRPVRVKAVDNGVFVTLTIDGDLNPHGNREIYTPGTWTRETSGEDVASPGDCGGETDVTRADTTACGTRQFAQTAGLKFTRTYAYLSPRRVEHLVIRFDPCRALIPDGMRAGGLPDGKDELRMQFDPNRLFGKQRVIRLGASRAFAGRDTEYSTTAGKAAWSVTLTRVPNSIVGKVKKKKHQPARRNRGGQGKSKPRR